jgi:predicted enzyme related to lactoylglutathione lyase
MADTFIWYELITTDLDAALDFYTHVVGWTAADFPGSLVRYSILSARDRGVGGAMRITEDIARAGAKPAWLGYIHAGDVDARAEAIKAAGGAVHVPPTDIPGVGRFALVTDPGGAYFYIMTPRPPEGGAREPLAQYAPGNVGWHELYAGDGEAEAFDFYAGQFGWTTASTMDMGEMGQYRLFATGGGEAVGGMMDKPREMPMGAWGYYFNVDAIDPAQARVEAKGGKVIMGPMEVPNGMWVLQGIDPQGAHFALVAPKR